MYQVEQSIYLGPIVKYRLSLKVIHICPSPVGSIQGFSKIDLLNSMLWIVNSSENKLILVDVAEEDELVTGGITSRVIQILSKSQKPPKIVKEPEVQNKLLKLQY